jgi:iron complex outermembrane recepter protein
MSAIAYPTSMTLRHRFCNRVPGLTSAIVSVCVATSASAADQRGFERVLEEVMVTAQKRQESLQDVPMSISVLTSETIEQRSLTNLGDFIRTVPSVNYSEDGPGKKSIIIRGISGDGDDATGTYLGEMPLTSLNGLIGTSFNKVDLKLVDMERIEVLRGPQGTLYGASSMGGTLRYIPNAPELGQTSSKVDVRYSHTDHAASDNKDIAATVNLPLVDDTLALRVVGYGYHTGGYIDYVGDANPDRAAFAAASGARLLTGDDGGAIDTVGGRASLLWRPTERFSATLNYLNQQDRQEGTGQGDIRLRPYQDHPMDFGALTTDGREWRRVTARLYNLVLNLELDKLSFVSSSSRADFKGGEARDLSKETCCGTTGVLDYGTTQATTQEVRASSKFAGPLNFLFGVYYEQNKFDEHDWLPWLGDPALCCEPSYLGSDPSDILDERFKNRIEQKAVFSELYYDVFDPLRLTVGARYYDYERTIEKRQTGGLNGGLTSSEGGDSRDGTTFKVNLTYSMNEDSMVYAQWAEGFRLGTTQSPAPSTCDTNNDGLLDGTAVRIDQDYIEPDTVSSLELGGKFAFFNGRWVLNTAVYRTLWQDIPGGATSISCGYTVRVNVGEQRLRGFELDTTLAITPQLLLNLSASKIHAKQTKGFFGESVDVKIVTPPSQGNVGLQYGFDFLGYESYIRGDYSYIDAVTDTGFPLFRKLEDYKKVDLRAGLDLGSLNAALYATNVTNESPILSGGFYIVSRLQPRTVGVQLGYQF